MVKLPLKQGVKKFKRMNWEIKLIIFICLGGFLFTSISVGEISFIFLKNILNIFNFSLIISQKMLLFF